MKRLIGFCLSLLLISACSPAEPETKIETVVGSKRIALSYDDAPRGDSTLSTGVARTEAIIAQLEDANAGPAVFFITTKGLKNPEGRARVAAYAEAGHLIANHSDTHMWASRTNTETYIEDIDAAESKLTGYANRRAWYRFPYLDEGGRGETNSDLVKRDALRAALAERGLQNGYVTVDTYDWHLDQLWNQAVKSGAHVDMQALLKVYVDMVIESAAHYDRLGQEVLGRRPAQIVLLHENDLAARFTGDVVRGLRAEGWTIISPDEAYEDLIADVQPATPVAGSGQIAAMAIDAAFPNDEIFGHWSISRKGIEARLEEANVFTKKVDAEE